MHTRLDEPRPARTVHGVLAALLAAAALLLTAPASIAHDTLSSSSPSEGDVVAAPEEVVLTFTGEVGAVGTAVEVTGPSGTVSAGEPVVDGRTVTVALAPDLAAGTYTVSWRVTSSDGHPISGEFDFEVEASEPTATTEPTTPATDTATDEPTGTATDDATAEETTSEEPETTASETTEPEPVEDTAGDEGVSPWVWVLAGVAVVALAGVAVAVARRTST